jgi:AraC family transcriptional regulator of adaptative response/methylated-DNA-[protein]-cysteine methyltransferase
MQMPRHTLADRIDEDRWQAVIGRDRESDGRFVYAVRSTGIYCRPSCPSRRPRRDRAIFFLTANEAERGGFRPCKRCRPQDTAQPDVWIRKISRACAMLASADGHVPLATLTARIGGSPFHFQRNFKRLVGVTPREYGDACRLGRAKALLRNGSGVTGAIVDAGYGSSSRFYERAAPLLGMPPSTYRRGGAGMTITYATVDSPLGRVLVAATPRGVCAVSMGASEAELTRRLAREFPRATMAMNASGALARWTSRIVAHLEGRRPRLDLPLDVRGTAFQWQVWKALAAIPYGETRSYSEVAVAIGRPSAVRAVARACATNSVALAIPCHRVAPAAGGTGGYRWGVRRKRALVAIERAARRKVRR